ncbi:petrobactin biosynthesis protein AsbD [Lysinibacillus fusiformis]|jgi:acyl carrier protein|uniref:petrobactin biosynthesis protein AsbD n=1 Tax=Lysinibacillus TaxID=400634 RepID=UPI0004D5200F|nr:MULTISPECIES: petrobactin biosynthesis protein AsbD [Lysinibacillus]MDC6266871.1 petrobactin biosynthesis protein AsbD [Lysinibacillus sphaericus]AJK87786.1 acyl carrier protein [Lysinibacillus fusiformis]KAB0444153.1 acyl carrier protein [Lysinibacillus fusiformis]KGA80514.1 acyl carrier protein [Lysinibacillus fusiformis]KHK49075.1 acyl carrier protein [Lysinibacillus sp. A1]
MTRQQLIKSIYDIMENSLELQTLSSFNEDARLNEDLYMDSIMVLQLILHIEMDLGIAIPDEVLVPKDFKTVGTLVNFLEKQQKVE